MNQSEAHPFKDIACAPQEHFLLHLHAAIFRLVGHIERLSQVGGEPLVEVFQRFPFLQAYLAEILHLMPAGLDRQTSAIWWETAITTWEEEREQHLPLLALSRAEQLDFSQRLALMLVGLVEEDSRFGTVFSWLQAPLAFRRPCWELINLVLTDEAGADYAALQPICPQLLAIRLLEVSNSHAPRSEWELRVPTLLWDMIRGEPLPNSLTWCQPHPAVQFPPLDALILPPDFQAQVQQTPALLQTRQTHALILRGTPGSQRLQVIGAVARAMGRGLIVMPGGEDHANDDGSDAQTRQPLGLLCTLTGWLPVLRYDLEPGETVPPPVLSGYSGPLVLMLGLDGGISSQMAGQSVTLTLPLPGLEQRRRMWQSALNGHPTADLEKISRRFHLPGDYICQAAAIAITRATLAQRQVIQTDDIQAACRTLNRQLLDTLATPLETRGDWSQLVVSPMTMNKLHELEQRTSHREALLSHLGPAFQSNSNRGVRALLTGPSGTGKTWATKILAAELEMDLYRVDLAAVVNKYIGETEKNLNSVLSRAEELDVILLLDEGDSLLGGRTDVKSANDRYANLETNYLLQKLETYQGIIVIATNLGENIDSAFQRRMDVVIKFMPPEAPERWQIWQLHLPDHHAVDAEYLAAIAQRCQMTGGQIRNTALHATLLALDDGSEMVRNLHLELALQSEYRKAGATYPLTQNRLLSPTHGGVSSFLNVLTG